ncbi:hypothetical protein LSH36_5g06013, partial [Paralvinella palmiformis]
RSYPTGSVSSYFLIQIRSYPAASLSACPSFLPAVLLSSRFLLHADIIVISSGAKLTASID